MAQCCPPGSMLSLAMVTPCGRRLTDISQPVPFPHPDPHNPATSVVLNWVCLSSSACQLCLPAPNGEPPSLGISSQCYALCILWFFVEILVFSVVLLAIVDVLIECSPALCGLEPDDLCGCPYVVMYMLAFLAPCVDQDVHESRVLEHRGSFLPACSTAPGHTCAYL